MMVCSAPLAALASQSSATAVTLTNRWGAGIAAADNVEAKPGVAAVVVVVQPAAKVSALSEEVEEGARDDCAEVPRVATLSLSTCWRLRTAFDRC